jgi:hypothetical protein
MPRRAVSSTALALAAALAAAFGGCSSGSAVFDEIKEGNFKMPTVSAPDFAKFGQDTKTAELGPRGPVAPEDLVDAAGRCGPEAVQATQAAAPEPAAAPAPEPTPAAPPPSRAKAAVGSIAGDLASAPMPQGPPPAPMPAKPKKSKRVASTAPADLGGLQPEGGFGGLGGKVMGGIALGMTECQAVRRAGQPSRVAIGAANKGERKVVLTYLAGPWPGVYTFESGRLKVVDAVSGELKADEPKKKKKPRRPARTATTERVYVQ